MRRIARRLTVALGAVTVIGGYLWFAAVRFAPEARRRRLARLPRRAR